MLDRVARETLRSRLAALLDFEVPASPAIEVLEDRARDGYSEQLVSYQSADQEEIRAFVLTPLTDGPFPAVVAYHQHRNEWHLGKSEVAGLAGASLQAFGPALARRGLLVLAPDAICFEDRRRNATGTAPGGEHDRIQHYNETSDRLLRGGSLMSAVVNDAAVAMSVLLASDHVDRARVGVVGHSYGGTTSLWHAALDERVRFACASGSACTYRRRVADGTATDFSDLIPGILELCDLDEVVSLIAPRPLLLVSATDDRCTADADEVARTASTQYASLAAEDAFRHERFEGRHDLTPERSRLVVDWTVSQVAQGPLGPVRN
jgi:dienelactone hydrolase